MGSKISPIPLSNDPWDTGLLIHSLKMVNQCTKLLVIGLCVVTSFIKAPQPDILKGYCSWACHLGVYGLGEWTKYNMCYNWPHVSTTYVSCHSSLGSLYGSWPLISLSLSAYLFFTSCICCKPIFLAMCILVKCKALWGRAWARV